MDWLDDYSAEKLNPFQLEDGLYVCPICAKLYSEEKAMYRHVVDSHRNGEYMARDLSADLYVRWQNRIPRCQQ